MPMKVQAASSEGDRPLPKFLAIVAGNDVAAVYESVNDRLWDLVVTQGPQQENLTAAAEGAAVILLDAKLTGDWRSAVVRFSRQFPNACIIVASTVPDDYLFNEAVRQGAFDVITMPLRPDELRRAAGLALAFWNHRRLRLVK